MTISREVDELTKTIAEKAEEYRPIARTIAAALVVEAVCVVVILILCIVIAVRVKR